MLWLHLKIMSIKLQYKQDRLQKVALAESNPHSKQIQLLRLELPKRPSSPAPLNIDLIKGG